MHIEFKGEIKYAVITVSSTRNEDNDESGKFLKNFLGNVSYYRIVRDDIREIRSALLNALDYADVIIFCGGSGISKKDVTYEAVEPFIEKRIFGFSYLFFQESLKEVGYSAILSRSFAGTHRGKIIFCIPGSKNAAETAARIIKKGIRHIVAEIRKEINL